MYVAYIYSVEAVKPIGLDVCLLCRTYPKGYKPPDEEPSEYQTIPLNKIEDFGVHCKQYYSLDVQYFKSDMDKVSLWGSVTFFIQSIFICNKIYTVRLGKFRLGWIRLG